jgi:hypothetical protein
MNHLDDNHLGKVYLFEGWDNSTKCFADVTVFAQGLHNPNQVMFYTHLSVHYIFIAETDKLSRYEYRPDDRSLRGAGQVLARFPDYGLCYKYGGWHLPRSLAQHAGKIYVSIGSS